MVYIVVDYGCFWSDPVRPVRPREDPPRPVSPSVKPGRAHASKKFFTGLGALLIVHPNF